MLRIFDTNHRVVAVLTEEGQALKRQATLAYAHGVRTHLVGALSRRQLATVADNCRRINAVLGLPEGRSTVGSDI